MKLADWTKHIKSGLSHAESHQSWLGESQSRRSPVQGSSAVREPVRF